MRSYRYLTWLDVKRKLAEETQNGSYLPEKITGLYCFSSALEVGISQESCQEEASNILKEWFGDWYDEQQLKIHLDIGEAVLPVEFILNVVSSQQKTEILPFWSHIKYLVNPDHDSSNIPINFTFPEVSKNNPQLIAFHSFKGGVGRTSHLAAYLFALLKQAKENKESLNILIIDSDLEAPGLTYWNQRNRQKSTSFLFSEPSISFIQFLECYYYHPQSLDKTLKFVSKEIKQSVIRESGSNVYFLPAFLQEEQLLDIQVFPKYLTKNLQNKWEFSDAIYQLGQTLGVDYILIDLRAGLSEISSPILFDPRVERFLVTSLNQQSIQGTCLILQQISQIAPPEDQVKEGEYFDPSIIISLLKPEFKALPEFENSLTQLQLSYIEPQEDALSTRLTIYDSGFSEELMYLNTWDDVQEKLEGTSVFHLAQDLVKIKLENSTVLVNSDQVHPSLEDVKRLKETTNKYIYAEKGEGEDLLITESLRNLALNFQDKLPNVVSIGSKGAGKTFNYIQLSRLQYWQAFLRKFDNSSLNSSQEISTDTETIYIFPFLQSTNLNDKAREIVNNARNNVFEQLNHDSPSFAVSDYIDSIKTELNNNWSEPQWATFWIKKIAESLGILTTENMKLSEIDHYLKEKSLKVIFLWDGLEDVFNNIASDEKQQTALNALISNVLNKLAEIRKPNLGMIVFLRRDFVRHSIKQNNLQFENRYQAYDLFWDEDSFIKLVLWICIQSKILGVTEQDLELSSEEMIEKLEGLWGKKLGQDTSREAVSYPWVFGALTDFKGQLQARDIVRFLFHAATITIDKSQDIELEKWSNSRLLPPKAIRRALKPCSDDKIEEAKQEYPIFEEWVNQLPSTNKKIPFSVTQFNMKPITITTLEQMGVIYEDKDKQGITRYYIPEIFREGLGFTYNRGARPRVIALKRKIVK